MELSFTQRGWLGIALLAVGILSLLIALPIEIAPVAMLALLLGLAALVAGTVLVGTDVGGRPV